MGVHKEIVENSVPSQQSSDSLSLDLLLVLSLSEFYVFSGLNFNGFFYLLRV